jgi:2-aminoadipate transaminase
VETISFAGDGLGPDLIPTEELADCAATVLGADGGRILSYGTGAGYTPLRELVGQWLGVHPFRVVLTNGWLQGFALLVKGKALGRNVVVEYPTYDRVLELLFGSAASLVYADVHEEGINFDNLEYQLRVSERPLLAYTMPTFQNPTGLTLPLDQRVAYCRLVQGARIPILEDDSLGLLRFEGEQLPTLFELTNRTSIYSTSFSYTIAPGLRVGVFVLPEEAAGELAAAANATYITPVLLSQAIVFELMRRESFEPNLERVRGELLRRRDATVEALEQHLPGATWTKPEGGIFLLLKLPPGKNAKEIVDRAAGVTAAAGGVDFGAVPNTIRLNFAEPALEEIEPGIERLAAVLGPELDAG